MTLLLPEVIKRTVVGLIGRIKAISQKLGIVAIVILCLAICLPTLAIVYYITTPPEITDFSTLGRYNGMNVRITGIVLYREYSSVDNEAYMELYGLEGGTCRVYIEYVENPENIMAVGVNDIITLVGEVYISGTTPVITCPNDGTLDNKGRYRAEVVDIEKAVSGNYNGKYVAVEGTLTDIIEVGVTSAGIAAMEVSDATGSIEARLKVATDFIPVGSTLKLYGVVKAYHGDRYLEVYSPEAIIITYLYNASEYIPLSVILSNPDDYMGTGIKTKGYVVYTPIQYNSTVVFYIGNSDGSDFKLPEVMVKCIYHTSTPIGLEKGDAITLQGFTLDYDTHRGEYFLEGSAIAEASVEITERYGEWTPPLQILCENPWMFEGTMLNITGVVDECINETAYRIKSDNARVLVLSPDGSANIVAGDSIRVAGRLRYISNEGTYAIYAENIIKA